MKNLNKMNGRVAEQIAVQYLQQDGYLILDTNWQCKIGEIDIIALKGDYLVIVEVRSRKNDLFGSGLESINLTKQKKIAKTSVEYIKSKDFFDKNVRFDCIQIDGSTDILHIVDAFDTHIRI
ncbi:MAG: YraN family protein [Clostridiales bacterium]|jgi:putative endonuclease|nr:YraN family protein [Clostridiales bacterium]